MKFSDYLLMALDNDYEIDAPLEHLQKYREEPLKPTPATLVDTKGRMDYTKFTNVIANIVRSATYNQELKEFELKALDKWWGLQGGTPDKNTLMEIVDKYYQNVEVPSLHKYKISSYTKYVIKKQVLNAIHQLNLALPLGPISSPRKLYNTYVGDHKSNSGVIMWSDRRRKEVKVANIKAALQHPTGADPVVVGSRHMRNKYRTIFMTTQADLFRYNRLMLSVRDIFKETSFVAWKGNEAVEDHISEFILKRNKDDLVFFEADYETMDTWVTLDHALLIVQLLEELNIISQALADQLRELFHSVFTQGLLTPDEFKQSIHALFSGLPCTNDLESLLNIVIQLEWILYRYGELEYGRDFIVIVLGDDVIIVYDKRALKGIDFWKDNDEFAKWVWDNFHIKANPIKQRISTTGGFFCKRYYSIKNKRKPNGSIYSYYPVTLAANSILHPENASSKTPGMRLIRIWQILDNIGPHPLLKQIYTIIFKYYSFLPLPTISDVEKFNAEDRNWKRLLAGVKFSIDSSPCAQWWVTNLNRN